MLEHIRQSRRRWALGGLLLLCSLAAPAALSAGETVPSRSPSAATGEITTTRPQGVEWKQGVEWTQTSATDRDGVEWT